MRPELPQNVIPTDPDEQVVEEFMEGSPRAGRLEELCDALRTRIRAMRDQLNAQTSADEREQLEKRIEEARHQIAVLRQEQAISQFVEDSVRATLRADPRDAEYGDLEE